MSSAMVPSATDPTALLNTQLASALSTFGDSQFWEETISPSTIRNELSSSDPSNPNSTPTLQKGMKWLLASISKGRDVSDFYPHVVKLVGATSLEVRKMVYMYLVQYADHDATTRELSLLSINSFQRGLADHEQLIRALALRVLSSIRIPDILQIQILGVQKCAKDHSPYVRKCAANAISKLSIRCDEMQREMLLDILKQLLDSDSCTMVLSSCLIAFNELCPERLDLIHTSYRKICHLLTDMDEWGQVIIIDMLARYCRKFFKAPRNWKGGTAERIDRERRVRRTVAGLAQDVGDHLAQEISSSLNLSEDNNVPSVTKGGFTDAAPKKIKRRVVQKGFYSDEEDESTEEEVYAESPLGLPISTASAMRQRNIMGLPGVQQQIAVNVEDTEDIDLDEDHKLLLQSAMPLLKSRNAGVVLSVCSLLYYCGVSSIKSRSAMGKALVRIHRGRREIQYVVLTSIRTLVTECPSAFAPFLNDFFVKAMDPPHTRMIKLDILVSLALEPAAIEAVLKELRTYIRNGDKKFVCAAIRAVGRVAELARIVYDRHGQTPDGDAVKERKTANRIALDCLYGLSVVTQTCDSKIVVGEAVCVMQSIITLLSSDAGENGSQMNVEDPNDMQGFAMRRILLLLVNGLSRRVGDEGGQEGYASDDDDEEEKEDSELDKVTVELVPRALASAMWLVGEWISKIDGSSIILRNVDGNTKSQMRLEIVRLIDRAFLELDSLEREQGIHFASKVLIFNATGATPSSSSEHAVCEHILSMGRVDVNPDVKDRARFESAVIHSTIGLKVDTDAIDALPTLGKEMTVENTRKMLLDKKPAPSFLPVQDERTADMHSFRFGTLSSIVGHQARGAYLRLPPWGDQNSPKALRDPVEETEEVPTPASASNLHASSGFYAQDSDSSSSSSSSLSSDGQRADSESDSEESSDDSSSDSDSSDDNNLNVSTQLPTASIIDLQDNLLANNLLQPIAQPTPQPVPALLGNMSSQLSSEDETSSSDDDSASSSSSSSDEDYFSGNTSKASALATPKEGNLLSMSMGSGQSQQKSVFDAVPAPSNNGTSAMDDLKGLVMAPVVVDEPTSDGGIEMNSSKWIQLVRPELCGGLSMKARYLRGPSREREIQLKGLDPKSSCVVCVEVQFANKKMDHGSLRRVRLLQRAGPSGAVAVKRAVWPPEIPEIKKGQVSNTIFCVEFASASNREGDMTARVDVKTSTGGIPVEFKPSLGELLQPAQLMPAEFDSTMARMQGFQRVSSKFKAADIGPIPKAVLKHAAFTPVGKLAWKEGKLRLVGGLPAGNDLVLVLIEYTDGSGSITVCCDHAVAVNSVLNVVQRAVYRD